MSEDPLKSPQKTTFQWSWTNRGWLVYEGENQEWKPQNPGTNPARLKIRSKDSSHIRIEQNIYFYAPGKGSTNLLMINEDRIRPELSERLELKSDLFSGSNSDKV